MNIWFFNHYAVPPSYYPLARPFNFAKYLLKKGNHVKIFAASTVHNSNINLITGRDKYKEEVIDNINYVYLKTRNYRGNGKDRIINMFQYTLGLFKLTKKLNPPDVIIATSVHPLACVAGIKIAKKYKCKCIVEIADLWPLTLIEFGLIKRQSLIAKLLYRLEHWIYKNADSIIFTMEGGKEYVNQQFGKSNDIDLSKINYINNGIDLETYNKQKIENEYEDFDLENKNIFKVVYTGSLGKANSPNYIVEAAKIIQEKGYEDIRFIIFGSGSLTQELEEYCRVNGLKNITFKGKVDKSYIPSILSKGDLNIITGEHLNLYKYGLSLNKMFDYMASGKPTISNIECGFDNLKKYQCGITVNGGNADHLVEGILNFYQMDQKEYDRYCVNALNAASNFDFKNLTSELENIILETMN